MSTNGTSSNVSTPPVKIRSRFMIPNGKETDGSLHYDEARVMTDADLVELVNYIKHGSVAAILSDDDVQTAIAKLDSRDDDLEAKIKAETTRAKGEEQRIEGKVNTAQATATAAQSAAATAQSAAEAAQQKAATAQSAAETAQQKADAAYALAEANKCKCSSGGSSGGSSSGSSSGDPNSDINATIKVGSLVCWCRNKTNGKWYACFSLTYNFGNEVDSVSFTNATVLPYISQISHQSGSNDTIEIGGVIGSGNENWIESYSGKSVNVTFTIHAGSKTNTISQTVTIPAYNGQRKNLEWVDDSTNKSVSVSG